jgi:hypothetical protein
MIGKAVSYLLFALAALAAGYGAIGVAVGTMPNAIVVTVFAVALALFAAGVFVRDPESFLHRKPVDIVEQTGEIPIARKPRVPIAERPFEKEHTPRTMGDIPTVQVGIAMCGIGLALHRFLRQDPPILPICCVLVGAVLIFIGRAEGR